MCSEIRTKIAANPFVPWKLEQVFAVVLSYNNSRCAYPFAFNKVIASLTLLEVSRIHQSGYHLENTADEI